MSEIEIEKTKYDVAVAIIGGGISGLYCAMKLTQHLQLHAREGTFKIVILEQCDRWGGRLETDIVEIPDNVGVGEVKSNPIATATYVKEEEGGMRFTYKNPDNKHGSNMPRLSRLIKDLDMQHEIEPFYMKPQWTTNSKDNKPKDPPNNNVLYFGNKHFTEWYAEQNPSIWNAMFSLDKAEQFKSADDIVKEIYRRLLDHNSHILQYRFPRDHKGDIILAQKDKVLLQHYEDSEYWAFFRNAFTWPVGLQEIPLNEFSMQALLVEMGYSHSCCMMLEKTLGFRMDSLSNGISGNSMQSLVTFELIQNNLYQFKDGWTSLLKKLLTTIKNIARANPGIEVEFRKNCRVDRILPRENNFTIQIENGESSEETVKADYVVVALPPKAVKEILSKWISNPLNPEAIDKKAYEYDTIMQLCDSVMGVHLTKINLYFQNDWWNKDKNVTLFGPNVTSLPCAFVYPFYGVSVCKLKNCEGCSDCSDDPCPSALTIYCDVTNAQFWSSLQRLGHKFQSPLQKQRRNLAPASEAVVAEAIRELQKIFNCTDVPQPLLTSYRSWDGDYYGFGVHMWSIGVDDRNIEVAQPMKDVDLYFCNEAWSGYQSWVEGSLQSTDNVLNKIREKLAPSSNEEKLGQCE